jgi:hypothetical protein
VPKGLVTADGRTIAVDVMGRFGLGFAESVNTRHGEAEFGCPRERV